MTEVKSQVDFQDVFERMPEPLGVCDEDGVVHALNAAARELLVPESTREMRLDLSVRETVRQMRVTKLGIQEFYMADVHVEGAGACSNMSVSLLPLKAGGYRVRFEARQEPNIPVNLRLLEAMVNVNRHLELFKSPEKVVALFAASFAEVFPEDSFHLQFERPNGENFLHQHAGWTAHARRREGAQSELSARVPSSAHFWGESSQGYRVRLAAPGQQSGFVQFERVDSTRYSVVEREAFEAFGQQVMFALSRIWHRTDFSLVSPIIDQLDAVVIVCDARRTIRVCNRTFESLVYDEEVIGRDLLDFFSESSRAEIRTAAATVMAGGSVKPIDAALVNGDGSGSSQVILTVQIASNAPSSEAGQGFLVTGQQNELNLVELEERLTRAEHLMNLGQLATGVAHELKNPLTSILNYADYLLRKYEDSHLEDRDKLRLQRIIDGVEHIDSFVRDLMTLARPAVEVTERVRLHEMLRASGSLCELPLQRARTELRFEFCESDPFVKGSSSQLKQVFINLVTNASRAMGDEGGTVKIVTSVDEDKVEVRVLDDACGMSQETLNHIFEPFFTTRDGRGGTGLGLAIVQNIVERHRGTIEVESQEDVGTTFVIRMPRHLE